MASWSVFVILAFAGCRQPDYSKIKTDFEKAHPECVVATLGPGEGDADNVYVQIKYTCDGDTRQREVEWLYQRRGDQWIRAGGGEPVANPAYSSRSSENSFSQQRTDEPLRVGGDVEPPILLERVEPKYPQGKRRAGGAIVLECVVTRTGVVRDVKIIKGADDPMASYVAAAVKQWKFRPATRRGEPVDVIYSVTTFIHVR